MKGYSVYRAIMQLKERGFRKDAIAKRLGINWRTVDRYWDMSAGDYEKNISAVCKGKLLDDNRPQIIRWQQDYPTLSAAQICNWLIESVVKYIKGNFLENRLFADDGILCSCCREWLERTANAKPHGTQNVFHEVFAQEREHLRPLIDCTENSAAYICRTVRKDNTSMQHFPIKAEKLAPEQSQLALSIPTPQIDS